MKIQTTLVMLGLFVVAVGLYALVEYSELPTAEQREQRQGLVFADLAEVDNGSINRIELVSQNQRVVLHRQRARWQITEPINVLADPNRAAEIIRQIKQLRMKPRGGAVSLADRASAELADYGLEQGKSAVTLHRGDQTLASLRAGNEVFEGVYVKNEDEDDFVYVVDPASITALHRSLNELRLRELVTIRPFDTEYVHVAGPDGQLTVTKQENEWHLTLPIEDRADSARVSRLLGDASALKAGSDEDFIDDDLTGEERTRYGLDDPYATIEIRKPESLAAQGRGQTDGELENSEVTTFSERILIGAKLPDDEAKRYAMIEGQSYAVAVAAADVEKLEVTADQLRSRDLVQLATFNVDYFRIDGPGGTVICAKPETDWSIYQPKPATGDKAAIDQFLGALDALVIKEFLDDADPAEYGLGESEATTVALWESSLDPAPSPGTQKDQTAGQPPLSPSVDTVPVKLLFGRHDEDSKVVYVARPGRNGVVTADDSILQTLQAGYLALRDRRIFDTISTSDVDRIDLRRDEQTFTLLRPEQESGQAWRMTEPVSAPADQPVVERLVSLFSSLRAERFAAELSGDLERFGLDRPSMEITLTLKETNEEQPTSFAIQIGKETGAEGDQEVYYARQPNGELVFTVSADNVSPLLAELRDRTVFAFNAADVSALTLAYPQQRVALKLDTPAGATEPQWSFVGDPLFALDVGKVRSLVSTLSPLQASRFAQYEGEVKEEYGLAHPALVVEITLGDNTTKTLTLGSATSTSGRFATALDLAGAVIEISSAPLLDLAEDTHYLAVPDSKHDDRSSSE